MPTLVQLKSALDALAFRLQSLSRKERERLGRREVDEIEALVKLGLSEARQIPTGRGMPDELARLDRLATFANAHFEVLLAEPSRTASQWPPSSARAPYRRDPGDWHAGVRPAQASAEPMDEPLPCA